MNSIGAPHIVTVVGIALVALQIFQLQRGRRVGRRSRITILMLLLGCNLIVAPLLDRVKPIISAVIGVGLLVFMVSALFAPHEAK